MKIIWAAPAALILFVLHFVFGLIPYFLFRVLFLRKAADDWLYRVSKITASALLGLLGVKIDCEIDSEAEKLFKEHKPVCLVSNHTSFLDIPLILVCTGIQMGFITKRSVVFFPFINLIAASMGCIFINRSSLKKGVEGIRRGAEHIKNGRSMLVFPEGTRSKTGEIAPFKHGSFRLAMESYTCVVPVTVKGIRQSLEDRSRAFGQYTAYVRIGKPISMTMEEPRDIRFEQISSIESNIRETYASLGGK